jgi:hypothetical protein
MALSIYNPFMEGGHILSNLRMFSMCQITSIILFCLVDGTEMDTGTLAIMAYLHSLPKREEGLHVVLILQIIYIKCNYNTSLNYNRPSTLLKLQRLPKVGRYGINASAISAKVDVTKIQHGLYKHLDMVPPIHYSSTTPQ